MSTDPLPENFASVALKPQSPGRPPGRPKDLSLTLKRREDILEMATQLFAKKGFRNTDLRAVADGLGVAKGTIYNYFDSKNELFFACVQYGMDRLREAVEEQTVDESDPLRRIKLGIQTYFSYFDEHHDLVELLIQERAEFKNRVTSTYFLHWEEHCGPWLELFASCQKAGIIREDLDIETIHDFVSNQIYGTLFANYFSGDKRPLKDQADKILRMVFDGILTN